MNSIVLGKKKVDYNLIRSKRKTLGIIVDPEQGLVVRSPETLTCKVIKATLQSKSDWILRKLEYIKKIKPEPAAKEFMSGEKLPYLGKYYRLNIIEKSTMADDQIKVKKKENSFKIYTSPALRDTKYYREFIRKGLIHWYRYNANIEIKLRIGIYRYKIGVMSAKVKVKKQKKRWGSCTGEGNIYINWRIIMAPMSIVDYIVVHELAHLKHKNHSPEFWQLVEAIIPDYKEKQQWLRINGRTLTF